MMIAADVRTETSRLLAELIRIDTSNPPGNETAAAEHLAAYLADAGVKSELVGREPHRASLIARLPGTGDGPSLMLLGHTDVVGADADEWSVPPFSGLERDGFVWGRGALDMKGQVAAEAVAVATLAREGWRGAGDLILCAVADEEVGDDWGLSWLVQEHPDLVRADYVLNEGGGERIEHRGRVAYTVGVGEKRCAAFAVTVHGKSGHASTPGAADNALVKLGPVIDRIQRMPRPTAELAALADFLAAVGEDGADPAELVSRCRSENPLLAAAVEPMLGATIAPTISEASTAVNIIPGRARLVCDCRILPEMTHAEIEGAARAALAGVDFEFEFVENVGGKLSTVGDPRADGQPRFHRQPLHARGVRLGRLRLHADADGSAPRRGARPLGRRAGGNGRPRAGGPLLPARCPHDGGGRMSPPTVRLGGMALRNGILVHSLAHWAAAVRTEDGEIRLASGKKPDMPDAVMRTPLLRGVARMAEAAWLLPVVRRRLPDARLPVEGPGMGAALAGSAILAQAVRRSRLHPVVGESLAAAAALAPALMALRGSEVAGYHGAEHKAIGAYEKGTDAVDATKEHERCGSHMVGPIVVLTAAGNALASRLPESRRGPARLVVGVAALGAATEAFGWMGRHSDHPVARALRRPGFELQRVAATREPSAAELEVAEAALGEVLRLEGVPQT